MPPSERRRARGWRRGSGWLGLYPLVALSTGIGAITWGVHAETAFTATGAFTRTIGISSVQTFTRESSAPLRLQTGGLALPGYASWELNGSAGITNGYGAISGGRLTVGVREPTKDFRGFFLTTQGSTPARCTFHAWAASAPPVRPPAPLPGDTAPPLVPPAEVAGEMVFAVQTANTTQTGLINYVLFTDHVSPTSRNWQVGYAQGLVANATTNVLARVDNPPGPGGSPDLHIVLATNGSSTLTVMVNGTVLLHTTALHMKIPPPFQPYLEVQARGAPYAVSFSRFASICGDNVTITGLPRNSSLVAGGRAYPVRDGRATIPRYSEEGPLDGTVTVRSAGGSARNYTGQVLLPGNTYRFTLLP